MSVKLTAELVESFAGLYLSPRYDDAKPTPQFHREAWELYCSEERQAGCIAPRDHAKSTALTFDYILAEVCFRSSDYVILIGSTEPKASEQLSNISEELANNEDLRRDFKIQSFETEQKTEIIVVCTDGHRFRILARGAEQKIRGAMWNGKRPNLIVCDDMEDDEQVESKERRGKFRRWFFRAARPALSKKGKFRIHGTILHEDSLLSRLRKNKVWKLLFYKAHRAYNDFSELLWPERWTEADLRSRRTEFEEDGDGPGYSQEFLNTPLDSNASYLKKADFIEMTAEDHAREKKFSVGVDFAIKKSDSANHTAFVVGGKCIQNLIHHVHVKMGRMNSLEIIEEFFTIEEEFQPDCFYVEGGQIWLAIEPMLQKEMLEREIPLTIVVLSSVTDKAVRGRTFQKKMRAKFCRFDKTAEWYPGYEAELLAFTGVTEALHDDQFDGTSILHRGLELAPELDEEDFKDDEELEFEYEQRRTMGRHEQQRNSTGY